MYLAGLTFFLQKDQIVLFLLGELIALDTCCICYHVATETRYCIYNKGDVLPTR